MRARCPKARFLDNAILSRHRFVLMGNGYASVCRDRRSEVHGVLYDLAFSDIPALDRYEEVAGGLYVKAMQPVRRQAGQAHQALIYFGTDETIGGTPPLGHMEAIVAAARSSGLPASYVAKLETFLPKTAPRTAFSGARSSS